MRIPLMIIAIVMSASSAAASCVGTDAFQTCYDTRSGNSYSIQKFGDTTHVYGSNSRTGATWSQRSTDFGDTTLNSGVDKHGRSWNSVCVGAFCN